MCQREILHLSSNILSGILLTIYLATNLGNFTLFYLFITMKDRRPSQNHRQHNLVLSSSVCLTQRKLYICHLWCMDEYNRVDFWRDFCYIRRLLLNTLYCYLLCNWRNIQLHLLCCSRLLCCESTLRRTTEG